MKPPRSILAPGTQKEDKHLELAEDAEEQQKRVSKIVTKAVALTRNGQQKEAIRELAKLEDLIKRSRI
jgi:hypothetical protein